MIEKLALAAFAAVALSTIGGAARADETNAAIVHRQGIYKVAQGHMMGLKASGMKDGPAKNMSYHADGLVAAFQHLGNAFPPGSDKGETKAKANIWTERAKFDEAGKTAFAAATEMAAAAKSGDREQAMAAFKNVARACKACHEDFRKE